MPLFALPGPRRRPLPRREAYPPWRAGTLAGHPAEEMTTVFLTPVAIAAVPWGDVLRHHVLPVRARVA